MLHKIRDFLFRVFFRDTFALMHDAIQEIKAQQLLDEAILSEFIEWSADEIDNIHDTLAAIQIAQPGDDFDKLIEIVQRESLKRQLVALTKHLGILLEQQAQYGIAAPPHLIIQIERIEEKIQQLRTQIEHK